MAAGAGIDPLHYIDSEPVTGFFLANWELLHALGVMFTGNDWLSPLVNRGWGVVALLAAWIIGRPYGVAPLTLTGVGLRCWPPWDWWRRSPVAPATMLSGWRFSSPVLPSSLLLPRPASRVALRVRLWPLWLQGSPSARSSPMSRRPGLSRSGSGYWPDAGGGLPRRYWLVLVALPGAFWYVRNLVAVGNPLPSLNLKSGRSPCPVRR